MHTNKAAGFMIVIFVLKGRRGCTWEIWHLGVPVLGNGVAYFGIYFYLLNTLR